jgi:bifunctional DNA-binding transcriptional regulator/antitoxin component of YhaV-PrlF toxin-antitoxin module
LRHTCYREDELYIAYLGNQFHDCRRQKRQQTPLVVPRAVRRRAGFKSGQELEIKASGGVITILPKLPTADDEYTPEQRRIIDARLKKSLDEVKKGHTAGPFNTADEMIASLKRQLKKATQKTKRRSR